MRSLFTKEQIADIKKNYGKVETKILAQKYGVEPHKVTNKANLLGLKYKQKSYQLSDEQCEFINSDLRSVKAFVLPAFNKKYGTDLSYNRFMKSYRYAVADGRIKSRYKKQEKKRMDSREQEVITQRKQIVTRILGGCQHSEHDEICGKPTEGRYCEAHVRQAYKRDMTPPRAINEIRNGRYG